MISYTLKHRTVNSDTYPLLVKINFNASDLLVDNHKTQIQVTFDSFGDIANVYITYRDGFSDELTLPADIGNVITLNDGFIRIHQSYLEGSYSVDCTYYVEVISVYDYNAPVADGIIYNGPEPSGLGKPNLNHEGKVYFINDNVSVPYLKITPLLSDVGVIYYYRVVGIDRGSYITQPSSLMVANLKQETDDIKYQVESSDDYINDPKNPTWTTLPIILDGAETIEIGKPETLNYSTLGKAVVESVPIFKDTDIIVNKRYVNSDNKLVLSLPNVWKLDNQAFNYRSRKSFRLTARTGIYHSEVSEVISYPSKSFLPIEKMVLLKRNATGEADPSIPSAIEQEGAETLRVWIRKNGLYYNSIEHNSLPYNLPDSKNVMALASGRSTFDLFNIDDNSCAPGQTYNYTVYLFDSYGTQSEAVTLIVRP